MKKSEAQRNVIKITQIIMRSTDPDDLIQNLDFFLPYNSLSTCSLGICHVPGTATGTADIKMSRIQYFPSGCSKSEILPRHCKRCCDKDLYTAQREPRDEDDLLWGQGPFQKGSVNRILKNVRLHWENKMGKDILAKRKNT